jgi:hypothetical protein
MKYMKPAKKSLLETASSDAWADRCREADARVDELRRDHGAALVAVDQIASRVAAGDPEARKQLGEAREHVAELEDSISAAEVVADAARRELLTAKGREETIAQAEHAKKTAACAKRVTAIAVEVEQLATKLQLAAVKYMEEATAYGKLTGRGRDFAAPEHQGKLRIGLRNLVVTTVAACEIPGYSDRTRGLLKPADTADFLK